MERRSGRNVTAAFTALKDERIGDGLTTFGVEVEETRVYRKHVRARDAHHARELALEAFKDPSSFKMLASESKLLVDTQAVYKEKNGEEDGIPY